MLLRIFL